MKCLMIIFASSIPFLYPPILLLIHLDTRPHSAIIGIDIVEVLHPTRPLMILRSHMPSMHATLQWRWLYTSCVDFLQIRELSDLVGLEEVKPFILILTLELQSLYRRCDWEVTCEWSIADRNDVDVQIQPHVPSFIRELLAQFGEASLIQCRDPCFSTCLQRCRNRCGAG